MHGRLSVTTTRRLQKKKHSIQIHNKQCNRNACNVTAKGVEGLKWLALPHLWQKGIWPQSPAPFDGLSTDLRSCDVFSFWKTMHNGFSKLRSRMMWFRHQNLQASLLGDLFLQEIIKFFKMMKTYHDEAPGVPVRHWQSWQGFKLSAVQDGDLCAVKIGQLSWDPAAKDVNQAELE